MTRIEPDRFVEVFFLGGGVETDVVFVGAPEEVPQLAAGHSAPRDKELRVDVLHVPAERAAVQILPQLLPAGHVAKVPQVVTDPVVVVLLVVVQPDLGQPDGVAPEDVHAAAPLVRRSLAKDVADVGAGDDLQRAAAHPRLEGELQVLPAPDVEPGVVGSQPLEKLAVDGEQSARHRRAPDRLGGMGVPRLFPGRHGVPVELEVPVEAADGGVAGLLVLKRVIADDIDDGADDNRGVARYPVQQRLQPAVCRLAVAVQVGEDLAARVRRAHQTRSDEADAQPGAHNPHLGKLGHVALEVLLDVVHGGGVVDKDDLVEQLVGGAVEDGVDGAEEDGPGLVVEADDDAGGGEGGRGQEPLLGPAPRVPAVSLHNNNNNKFIHARK